MSQKISSEQQPHLETGFCNKMKKEESCGGGCLIYDDSELPPVDHGSVGPGGLCGLKRRVGSYPSVFYR